MNIWFQSSMLALVQGLFTALAQPGLLFHSLEVSSSDFSHIIFMTASSSSSSTSIVLWVPWDALSWVSSLFLLGSLLAWDTCCGGGYLNGSLDFLEDRFTDLKVFTLGSPRFLLFECSAFSTHSHRSPTSSVRASEFVAYCSTKVFVDYVTSMSDGGGIPATGHSRYSPFTIGGPSAHTATSKSLCSPWFRQIK